MNNSKTAMERRPVPGRENSIPKMVVRLLIRLKVTPNAISITSTVFALCAALCLRATSQTDSITARYYWIGAAVLILLRLFCNLLDGMVAIASSQFSAYGDILNEVPDRLSDVVILIGAGFTSASSTHLGYIAAVMAVLVAYMRSFGNSLGISGLFLGPMSKQQRMTVLVLASLYVGIAPATWQPIHTPSGLGLPAFALVIVIVGSLWTSLRRLGRIAQGLKEKGTAEQ